MEITYFPKKVRKDALLIARNFISAELGRLKAAGEDLKNVAIISNLNPPRVTEVHRNTAMSENTLKRLIQGGTISVEELVQAPGLQKEHIAYLRSLIGNSNLIQGASLMALNNGYSEADIAAIIEATCKTPKHKKVIKK